MIANPPFPNGDGYRVEGGNIFGHVVFEEAIRIANPVEIGLKVRYRYWGAWIEYPGLMQWCWVVPEGHDPVCENVRHFTDANFHTKEIDLGRKAHPILYRNIKPRQSFSRMNKTFSGFEEWSQNV